MNVNNEADGYPDEIRMEGEQLRLIARKKRIDEDGIARYRMEYDTGAPVHAAAVEYKRGEIGLIFHSFRGGKIGFSFKLSEVKEVRWN